MDPEAEQRYLHLAMENPNILCSQVPSEVLEAATYDDLEPSAFYKSFLEAGHTQWLLKTYGPAPQAKDRINNAIVVLWVRALRLHNSRVLGRPDADDDRPFFSDEGLYF